jgi:hypothetical protein
MADMCLQFVLYQALRLLPLWSGHGLCGMKRTSLGQTKMIAHSRILTRTPPKKQDFWPGAGEHSDYRADVSRATSFMGFACDLFLLFEFSHMKASSNVKYATVWSWEPMRLGLRNHPLDGTISARLRWRRFEFPFARHSKTYAQTMRAWQSCLP